MTPSKRRLWDVSPPVSHDLAVFPGDTPPTREVLLHLADGDPITLSTLRATVHLGAHLDAPSHYGAGAESIEALALDRCLGPCRLVTARSGSAEPIRPDHLPGAPDQPRLLIRTDSYPDPTHFHPDFTPLAPELIEWLADEGVRLVGVDTPSVDAGDSKDLPAHRACLRSDVTILEGLVLKGVPDGLYELIALPLRLVGFEASPVRAVLREL